MNNGSIINTDSENSDYFENSCNDCPPLLCRRQHMGGWSSTGHDAVPVVKADADSSPDRLRGATHDLFELLERVQCSRLDDQRCVLPAYFSTKVSEAFDH